MQTYTTYTPETEAAFGVLNDFFDAVGDDWVPQRDLWAVISDGTGQDASWVSGFIRLAIRREVLQQRGEWKRPSRYSGVRKGQHDTREVRRAC